MLRKILIDIIYGKWNWGSLSFLFIQARIPYKQKCSGLRKIPILKIQSPEVLVTKKGWVWPWKIRTFNYSDPLKNFNPLETVSKFMKIYVNCFGKIIKTSAHKLDVNTVFVQMFSWGMTGKKLLDKLCQYSPHYWKSLL